MINCYDDKCPHHDWTHRVGLVSRLGYCRERAASRLRYRLGELVTYLFGHSEGRCLNITRFGCLDLDCGRCVHLCDCRSVIDKALGAGR